MFSKEKTRQNVKNQNARKKIYNKDEQLVKNTSRSTIR